MSKRKHVFRDDYEKKFADVKQSRKVKSYAHCCYCDSEIILEAMGKEKQQLVATMLPQNTKIWLEVLHQTNLLSNFLKAELHQPTSTTRQQQQRVLGHPFILPSISNHLFPMIALQISLKLISLILTAKNFISARTKTASIITGVLAPFATNCCCQAQNLESSPFQYLLMPPTITKLNFFLWLSGFLAPKLGCKCVFSIYDLCHVRHHNRQLALSVLHLRKMVLGCYVTSFYAHNAPVNFEGRQQTGKNNVFNLFSLP